MIETLTLDNTFYQVGLYMRLSREDIKSSKDIESESIKNQKDLLMQYVESYNLHVYDCYVDDGYSGTNFNRPDFSRMINDIETGKINMVITKDLSRLGRDYIGVGEYLERYFPSHNIRYIAITDNIDTYRNESNLDMAPFKAVFNDMYAKDISKKIVSSLKAKQREGKWVGGCEPLGYMQDPDNKNHLVINEEEAWIVRKIFDLALKGYGTYQIKAKLDEENIPTCSQIRNNKRTYGKLAATGIWNVKTVKGILTNQLYTGDLVQNRRKKLNYKIKKVVKNKYEDWIIVKNTHEPIVSKEDFKMANTLIAKNYQRSTKGEIRLLDGLLVCFECKHRIGICKRRKKDNKTYIVCNYYRQNSKHGLCTSHGFNYDHLEEVILLKIKEVCFNTLDKFKLIQEKNNIILDLFKNSTESEIEKNEIEIKTLKNKLDKVYMDKLDEKIDEDMYNRIREKIMSEIKTINSFLEKIKIRKTDNTDYVKECERLIHEFLEMKNIDRNILLRLVDRIEVHNNKELDIYFNFSKMNFF